MFGKLNRWLGQTLSAARNNRKPRQARLDAEALEAREVPALNVYLSHFDDYILNIDVPADVSSRAIGGNADVRLVGSDVQVLHRTAGEAAWTTTTFRRADLDGPIMHISFRGGRGGDRFINFTNIYCDAFGGDGNDSLTGGSGREALYGESGDDRLSGHGNVDHLYGGTGMDSMYGGDGDDVLEGMTGNDWMYGGVGNDVLRGGNDHDHLYGESGNDKLIGGWGTDYLSGADGNDYLDAGSSIETAVGGRGRDLDAWHWVSGGAQPADVIQGDSPTCWIVASIAAAARAGIDLPSRISYVGNGQYVVRLFQFDNPKDVEHSTMRAHSETVLFDGSRLGADAQLTGDDHDASDYDRTEFWSLIMQRAIIQATQRWDPSQTVVNPHSGGAISTLRMLTGRSGQWLTPTSTTPERMIRDLAAGKAIVFCTFEAEGRLSESHCYTVMRVFYDPGTRQYCITLRNPWGYDGDAIGDAMPRDGLVTLPWSASRARLDHPS